MQRAIAAHRGQSDIGAVNTDTGPPVKPPKASDEVNGSLSSIFLMCFFVDMGLYD